MRCDHFNFCFAVSTKSGTRAGLRTLYFSTGMVHLSWLLSLSLSLSLSPSLSICFEQGVAPRRMATGEPQYWSFIGPGQCDKVVMLFCPLTVFHHFCLFESFLVVASKAKKGCDV